MLCSITGRAIIIVVTALAFLVVCPASSWAQAMKGNISMEKGEKKVTSQTEKSGGKDITPPKDRVVLIGASYARGWNIGEIAGLEVVNKGVNGNQSFEMLARFQEDVIANKPRAVIIWGFINDMFRSSREEMNDTLEKVKEHYQKMVKMCQGNGMMPIIATEITIRSRDSWRAILRGWAGEILGQESYQAYVNKQVMAVNQWIKEFAGEHGLLLLDFEATLSDPKGVRKKEFATRDGSHISPEGYEELTSYAKEKVEKFLKK